MDDTQMLLYSQMQFRIGIIKRQLVFSLSLHSVHVILLCGSIKNIKIAQFSFCDSIGEMELFSLDNPLRRLGFKSSFEFASIAYKRFYLPECRNTKILVVSHNPVGKNYMFCPKSFIKLLKCRHFCAQKTWRNQMIDQLQLCGQFETIQL